MFNAQNLCLTDQNGVSEWVNKRLNFLDTHINIITWLTSYHEVKMVKLKNRSLPSSKSLTFKVRPSANSSHSFHFQEKLNLLFNKRFRDWTWAKTVTLGISKMPYIYVSTHKIVSFKVREAVSDSSVVVSLFTLSTV